MEPLVPQQPQSPSSPDGLSNEGDDEGTASIGRNRRHSSVTASSTHNVRYAWKWFLKVKLTISLFRECSLLKIIKVCPYRLRIASDAEWHFVSLLARNRVGFIFCHYWTWNFKKWRLCSHFLNLISHSSLDIIYSLSGCGGLRFLHMHPLSSRRNYEHQRQRGILVCGESAQEYGARSARIPLCAANERRNDSAER